MTFGGQIWVTTEVNQLMQERVIGFVEEALAVKRLKRVEAGTDLLINLNTNVQQQEKFTSSTSSFSTKPEKNSKRLA